MENGSATAEGPLAAALAGFEASRPDRLVHVDCYWRTRVGRHEDCCSIAAPVGASLGASVVQLSSWGAIPAEFMYPPQPLLPLPLWLGGGGEGEPGWGAAPTGPA